MMQHQFWITKQTLSRKFGRKEDECIVASDAELDAKLELFRNIQESCALIQRIIDKYQESICYLSQEASAMGRFLKENAEQDKTKAGDAMLNIGKSLVYFAQQQLILHEPLMRFYQELETFRQRAIGDTLQNVMAMEKGRTEYRAALSWMKNVSQQLDPDTTKQLEKFKKVQDQVRRGKMNFDKLAYDCLQKVDLLAAARCNMLNHTLSFYQNKFIDYTSKTAKSYTMVAKSFDSKPEDRTTDNVFNHSKINKTESNVKKKPNKEESLISENEATLIDNISTANLVDSSFEQLTNENSSSSETSKLLSKSQSERYSELHDVLMSECNNIFNDISLGELKNTETSQIDCNIDDDDTFLPSALLKQSLNNITNGSKLDSKSSKDKGSSDLLSKHNTKSWLNLFEELDPLSQNRNEKSMKNNSFV